MKIPSRITSLMTQTCVFNQRYAIYLEGLTTFKTTTDNQMLNLLHNDHNYILMIGLRKCGFKPVLLRFAAQFHSLFPEVLILIHSAMLGKHGTLTNCANSVSGTKAPFAFRPTANVSLNKHNLESLTREQQQKMHQCFMECFHDPFCKAVNVTSCEKSHVATEDLDFVKDLDNA